MMYCMPIWLPLMSFSFFNSEIIEMERRAMLSTRDKLISGVSYKSAQGRQNTKPGDEVPMKIQDNESFSNTLRKPVKHLAKPTVSMTNKVTKNQLYKQSDGNTANVTSCHNPPIPDLKTLPSSKPEFLIIGTDSISGKYSKN